MFTNINPAHENYEVERTQVDGNEVAKFRMCVSRMN